MKIDRLPQVSTDHEGQRAMLVPLANGKGFATFYPETLQRLNAQGVSPKMKLNSNRPPGEGIEYVKGTKNGKVQTVARLITEALPGEQVHYHDGDRTNLRDDNLYKSRGGRAIVDCVELLSEATDAKA